MRYASIEVLRFLAAVLVVWEHVLGSLSLPMFGAFGVDIFFVISGFVIMGSRDSSVLIFLFKRIIRIYPLYLVCTLAVVMIKVTLLGETSNIDLVSVIKSLLFIPNYQDGAFHFPIFHLGWSLNFEMIFYILFGVSIIFGSNTVRFIFVTVGITVLYFWPIISAGNGFVYDFYSQYYIFEFSIGMTLYKFRGKLFALDRYSSRIYAFILSFMAFAFLWFYYMPQYSFFGREFVFMFTGSAIVCSCVMLESDVRNSLAIIGDFLGSVSYPMYLLHPFVIGGLGLFVADATVLLIATIITSLIGSIVANRFYDLPVRKYLMDKLLTKEPK